MKHSHYVTPRTLDEAEFQPWGQAIFAEERVGFHAADKIVMWSCAASSVALVAMALAGWLA